MYNYILEKTPVSMMSADTVNDEQFHSQTTWTHTHTLERIAQAQLWGMLQNTIELTPIQETITATVHTGSDTLLKSLRENTRNKSLQFNDNEKKLQFSTYWKLENVWSIHNITYDNIFICVQQGETGHIFKY